MLINLKIYILYFIGSGLIKVFVWLISDQWSFFFINGKVNLISPHKFGDSRPAQL